MIEDTVYKSREPVLTWSEKAAKSITNFDSLEGMTERRSLANKFCKDIADATAKYFDDCLRDGPNCKFEAISSTEIFENGARVVYRITKL